MSGDAKRKRKKAGGRNAGDPLDKLTPEEQEYIKTLPPDQRIVRPDIIEYAEKAMRKHSELLKRLAKWDLNKASEEKE